jgi:PIN domain nuclease of toxin-antitoxin system
MKFLLDTQIFIWWDSEPEKLPVRLSELFADPSHTFVLSIASVWEMQIKVQLGKLDLNRPLNEIVVDQQRSNQLHLLPIELRHVLALQQLPLYHKDPFDRLIIAQALVEQLTLLSVDAIFAQYPVALMGK